MVEQFGTKFMEVVLLDCESTVVTVHDEFKFHSMNIIPTMNVLPPLTKLKVDAVALTNSSVSTFVLTITKYVEFVCKEEMPALFCVVINLTGEEPCGS